MLISVINKTYPRMGFKYRINFSWSVATLCLPLGTYLEPIMLLTHGQIYMKQINIVCPRVTDRQTRGQPAPLACQHCSQNFYRFMGFTPGFCYVPLLFAFEPGHGAQFWLYEQRRV